MIMKSKQSSKLDFSGESSSEMPFDDLLCCSQVSLSWAGLGWATATATGESDAPVSGLGGQPTTMCTQATRTHVHTHTHTHTHAYAHTHTHMHTHQVSYACSVADAKDVGLIVRRAARHPAVTCQSMLGLAPPSPWRAFWKSIDSKTRETLGETRV